MIGKKQNKKILHQLPNEMIKKVLESGGNVELVRNGSLQEYAQIALIKNF